MDSLIEILNEINESVLSLCFLITAFLWFVVFYLIISGIIEHRNEKKKKSIDKKNDDDVKFNCVK